jgi:hypothetical protein
MMSASTLASELEAMVPTTDEAEAIDRLVTAWETYFYEATVSGIACTSGTLAGASAAMRGALVGLSTPGLSASKLQSGIVAFWGVVATAAATIWVTVPLTVAAAPPPGLAGITAGLAGVFGANTAAGLNLADASTAIAAVLHPLNLGGLASLAPPPPGLTAPIL